MFGTLRKDYPLIQNDYRQEKIIFELFSGDSTGKSCKSPRGYYRGRSYRTGAHTGDYLFGELFSGALQENPVIAPGQLQEKMFTELFW